MIRLLGEFWAASGALLTHPWDASAYLVAGEEPTLIDCGSCMGYASLVRDLRAFGYEPGDIRRVYATHGHWDHLSAAAQLQREGGAELYVHEADRAQVEAGDGELTSAFLYGEPFPPATVHGGVEDGELLRINDFEFQVFHTPGHSRGSVCYWTESHGMKLLIAGDTLWGGYHPRIGSDLEAWKGSLDRLLELEFDVMTVGHSPPALLFDAKRQVYEARQQIGVYFDPWFKPFHATFRY